MGPLFQSQRQEAGRCAGREAWAIGQRKERGGRERWEGGLRVGGARTGAPGIWVVRGALEEECLLWALNSLLVCVCARAFPETSPSLFGSSEKSASNWLVRVGLYVFQLGGRECSSCVQVLLAWAVTC